MMVYIGGTAGPAIAVPLSELLHGIAKLYHFLSRCGNAAPVNTARAHNYNVKKFEEVDNTLQKLYSCFDYLVVTLIKGSLAWVL